MKKIIFILFHFNFLALYAQPDLKDIINFNYSDEYQLWVNDSSIFVYESIQSYQNRGFTVERGNGINKMSFANFDLPETGSASVKVVLPKPASDYELRPLNLDFNVNYQGNEISFSIGTIEKILIKEKSSWNNSLTIFANPFHVPPDSADVTYYFGSNTFHDYYTGPDKIIPDDPQNDLKSRDEVGSIHLNDGESAYIAENAVVRARFDVPNGARVKIFGRGIIAYGLGHLENFGVVSANLGPQRVEIEGITIVDSPGWNIRIFGGKDHLIDNVKTIGFWHYNSDGFQFGGNDSEIRNCFIECNDDNFSFSGGGRNIRIYNNVLWNLYNGGVFNFGWGNGQYQDIEIYDNVVLRSGDCCGVDPNNPTLEVKRRKAPFTMISYGGQKLERISFENITVEEILGKGTWIHFVILEDGDGYCRDFNFKNITIMNQETVWGVLEGTTGGGLDNFTFQNLVINDSIINSAEEADLTLLNATNISFTGPTGLNGNSNTQKQFYGLKQNYPNPFNPETIIEFTLKKSEKVKINIYNILGEKIKEIDLGTKSQGEHKYRFNSADLISGVYLYQIKTDGFSESKKMITLK
jgi:hypothetical protein